MSTNGLSKIYLGPQQISQDLFVPPAWYMRMAPEPPMYFSSEVVFRPNSLPCEIRALHARCLRKRGLWTLSYCLDERIHPGPDERIWRIFECEVCGETFTLHCKLF